MKSKARSSSQDPRSETNVEGKAREVTEHSVELLEQLSSRHGTLTN